MKTRFISILLVMAIVLLSGCMGVLSVKRTASSKNGKIVSQRPGEDKNVKDNGIPAEKNTPDKKNAKAEEKENPFFFNDVSKQKKYTYKGNIWNKADNFSVFGGFNGDAEVSLTVDEIAKLMDGKIYRLKFTIVNDGGYENAGSEMLYLWVAEDNIYLCQFQTPEEAKELEDRGELPPPDEKFIRCSNIDKKYKEGIWDIRIDVAKNTCTYMASNPNGHFEKFVWTRDTGLAEYSEGYGAEAYGFKLKLVQ